MEGQEGQLDLYCDGSSTNDAGSKSMARWAVAFKSGKRVVDTSGFGTNNEAEYKGLIAALNFVMLSPYAPHVVIHIDSELVFMQVMDRYDVKSIRLKKLHEIAQKLMATSITRVDSLELVLETGGHNPAHIVVNSVPDIYNGLSDIVTMLPKYEEMLKQYNSHADRLAEYNLTDTDRRPFDGEIRQSARQWINEEGKRVLGNLDSLPSKKFVWWLYEAGAKSVDVVDAIDANSSQSCNTLRVKLPDISSADLTSKETTEADKALECLTIMTDLEGAKVQQAWDDETVFYVIW